MKKKDFARMNEGIEIDEPIIERSTFNPPVTNPNYDFERILNDNQNTELINNVQENYSPSIPNYNNYKPKKNEFNDVPYKFDPRTSRLYKPPQDNPELSHVHHYDFDTFNIPNPTTKDNISVLRNEEKSNLLKDNRKEYLRIKINEVHRKKEKISQQLGEYKSKIDDIVQRINSIKNNRDSLLTKMNMEKNHISNLTQNSKDIKDKENKLRALIRVTRNEIIRYKSLLENEKMDVLEKQYEVYDNTLRQYEGEVGQEGNNLSKFTNDLCKYENDLKDLNDMFSIYRNKNNELNDELQRQARLESNLEIEENKINRNHIDDLM